MRSLKGIRTAYCASHITAVDSVTVFTSDVYADAHNPSNIRRYIDFELVKATKTGKYISEEIAKEIAAGGLKNFYTVVSCKLDESDELPIYEAVISAPAVRKNTPTGFRPNRDWLLKLPIWDNRLPSGFRQNNISLCQTVEGDFAHNIQCVRLIS